MKRRQRFPGWLPFAFIAAGFAVVGAGIQVEVDDGRGQDAVSERRRNRGRSTIGSIREDLRCLAGL